MKNSILLSAVIVLLVTLFSPAAQAQRPSNPTGSETTTATTPTRGTATRTTRPSASNRGTIARPSASNRGGTVRQRTNTTPRTRTNTTPRPQRSNPNYCPPGGNARTSNGNAQSTRRTGGSFGTQFGGQGRSARVGVRTRPGSFNGTTTRVRSTNVTRGKKATRSRRANRKYSSYDEVYGRSPQKAGKASKVEASASRRNR